MRLTNWDPNAPETEEDGIKAEGLRRLRVRQMSKAPAAQTKGLSKSRKATRKPKA